MTAESRSPALLRVAIAGGSLLARAGLRALLEREAGLVVVADAATLSAGFGDGQAPAADVVLVDVDDAGEPAVELMGHLALAAARTRVLAIARHADRDVAGALVVAGVRGIVSKDKTPAHLADAIRKVHAGELWIDRAMAAHLIADLAARRQDEAADPDKARIASLTPRERDVVALVAGGMSNKAAARRLGITDNTVRHHLTSIFDKLAVADRLALVLYAVAHGLVSPRRR